MKFFTDAEPANFCDGIEGSSSFYDIPVDVERDTLSFEIPDIGTECGPLVLLIQCIYQIFLCAVFIITDNSSFSFSLDIADIYYLCCRY